MITLTSLCLQSKTLKTFHLVAPKSQEPTITSKMKLSLKFPIWWLPRHNGLLSSLPQYFIFLCLISNCLKTPELYYGFFTPYYLYSSEVLQSRPWLYMPPMYYCTCFDTWSTGPSLEQQVYFFIVLIVVIMIVSTCLLL